MQALGSMQRDLGGPTDMRLRKMLGANSHFDEAAMVKLFMPSGPPALSAVLDCSVTTDG